jgi:uncharacterized BrkB/YihY/UPF0761 family membrane protein
MRCHFKRIDVNALYKSMEEEGMTNLIRVVSLVAGLIFAAFSTFMALFRGIIIQDACTGTGSLGNNFARMCSDDFINYVLVFSGISLFIMLALIIFSVQPNVKPVTRYITLGIFITYGIWLITFSSIVWDLPFFTEGHYPEGVNPHCLECPNATPTP